LIKKKKKERKQAPLPSKSSKFNAFGNGILYFLKCQTMKMLVSWSKLKIKP
jgi:hypothetical protein